MAANILNLPAYTVTALQENEHDYHVDAVTVRAPVACPHCHHNKLDGFGRREQMVKDLPMHGKRVGIYIDTRRYRCRSCGRTFYETLPEINQKRLMTNRLVAWIGVQAVKRTFASVAEEVGVVEGTIRNIFRDYVNELERTVRFETPKWMGIDEIHLIKPRCVISNIRNNTIVDILSDRNKKTVANYLCRLPGINDVQYVAMDMWSPYRDAVEAVMPQASIVIDKFHVVRMANESLERVRKSLRENLTPKQRRGLMHDRFVLLKRERDLNDKERFLLEGWCLNYPSLGLAYRQKEDFYQIFEVQSPVDARNQFEAWQKTLTPEIADAFSDLIRAWRNWEPYILNYFEHPVTNAYTESLNNLIRVLYRLGRGYSFEALRAKILFSEGAHKHKNSRPKFERRVQERAAPEQMVAEPIHQEYIGFATRKTYARKQKQTEYPKNYGADISTLVQLIESGAI